MHYFEISALNCFLLRNMLRGHSLEGAIAHIEGSTGEGDLDSASMLPFIEVLFERAFILGVRREAAT